MFRPVSLLAASLALTASLVSAQEEEPSPEKFLLKQTQAVGDVVQVDEDFQMSGTATVPSETAPFTMRRRGVYREEVLAGGSGAATTLKRSYSFSAQTMASGARRENKNNSYHGKSVTLRKSGRRVTATLSKGKLTPEEVGNFSNVFSPVGMPDARVGVGDTWETRTVSTRSDLVISGKGYATFEDIVTYQGHRCAQIRVVHTIDAVDSAARVADMPVSGYIHYALDLNRILAVQKTANARMHVRVRNEMGTVEGAHTHTKIYRYFKIAGKPVSAKKVASER